ncbi:MAG: sigma-70 family RNA polymerase sigma factor [Verrucomicrobiales bacterium]|nr:sigma-70 family RNA polymerase sigma factor [Verrucomicrobiales bacterium]
MNPDEKDSRMVALLTEHQLPLRHYVQSLLPGDSSAPDVTQLANTTLWKKREEFEPGTNFKAWAFAIARYEVLNYRKRQARDSRLVFSSDLEEVFAEELIEANDNLEIRQSALRACLEKLKPTDRDLILHRYYERLPLNLYAKKTGRSVGGIKVTLHRIRNLLQGCIEANLRDEGADA